MNVFTTLFLPQVYLFSMTCIAFWINTCFYKLKWSNETEAVKNSAGMLISMLIDFAYTGILCLVLIVPTVLGFYFIGAILALGIVVSISIGAYLLVSKTCDGKINAIEV